MESSTRLSQAQNEMLMAAVIKEEVREAVMDINPHKCPVPDGMSGSFYHHFWDTIGDVIWKIVYSFFQTGALEQGINMTNICLIPKKPGANEMKDFHPISLSNVAYKIIAKILAKRLKRVLPELISDTHASFVHDRLITDNILISHEMLHAQKSNNKCSEEFVDIKTDIFKAFDKVELNFLERALVILGFSDKCISLIMKCVSSVSYQVLINGQAYGSITPTRGIRQGDPLSPYMFIICTKMLVRLLKKA